MVIQCENCQRKYKIDPTKLKSDKVAFLCKQCGHKIIVAKAEESTEAEVTDKIADPAETETPAPVTSDTTASVSETADDTAQTAENKQAVDHHIHASATATTDNSVVSDTSSASAYNDGAISKRRFGLNAKMLLLFFFIPLCLVVAASAIYLWQLKTLTKKISSDSYAIVERLSKELVNDTATMVADQCKLYLDANPNLTKEELYTDVKFRNLALKTVGETGYTCIYSVPDSLGKSSLWVHPNEGIVGLDLPPAMKKTMGQKYQAWFKIYKGAYHGKASMGYYRWQEKDGSIRDKYMTCVPVKGTPYVVAATTYVDEIKRDVDDLKITASRMKKRTEMTIFVVFGFTMVLMGSIALFYSRRLKSNLSTIINAAEKISVGELDTEVKVNSKDEISDLAEAISRMQESIRLSIERLRRRR